MRLSQYPPPRIGDRVTLLKPHTYYKGTIVKVAENTFEVLWVGDLLPLPYNLSRWQEAIVSE